MIEPTRVTPFVRFSEQTGTLVIQGNSINPDMNHFYSKIFVHVHRYLKSNNELAVGLFFNDMNTSTAKLIFDLLRYLRRKVEKGVEVEIKWFVELGNTSMHEAAHDFASLFDLNIQVMVSGS